LKNIRIVFLVLLFGSVVFLSCTKKNSLTYVNSRSPKNTTKIINGTDVTAQDAFTKHLVGIFKKNQTMCTGVLIADNAVITAAHCASELKGGKISFGFQLRKLQFRPITQYKVHADYDEGAMGIVDHPVNDLLVVQFSGGLPAGYSPAEISDQDLIQNQTRVIIAGYGRDEENHYDTLKSTEVSVVETANYEFRTDEKKNGSCDGDSGGPVFFKNSEGKYLLVGSVSRGDSQCHEFGVYENMTYYKSWIYSAIK